MRKRAATDGRPGSIKLTLEERVTRLEEHLGIRRQGRPAKKPVNVVAYRIAFEESLRNNRKPMSEYLKHYSVPEIM